jgi:two-component system chemotaxis sensor kinase CheA
MTLSSDQSGRIEEILNRLVGEIVLATPGRDDGLIPSYSLLGELAGLCEGAPGMKLPVDLMRARLERNLDQALPFDEGVLADMRKTIETLQDLLAAARGESPAPGRAQSPGGGAAAPQAQPPGGAPEHPGLAPDEILKIDLGESRELLAEFHGEALEHLQQIEAALLALERAPDDQEALNSIFRSFHTIKGNAGFLCLRQMHRLAHEVESLLDLARNHRIRVNSGIITEILRSRDALQALNHQVTVALDSGRLPDRIIPVNDLIAAVRRLAAEGAAGPAKQGIAASPSPSQPQAPEAAVHPCVELAVSKAGGSQTVRVNTEKLDALMDVVGELVIVQSQLNETTRAFGHAAPPLGANVSQLSRITKELQHTAMSLRMVPIQPIFQKMERLARDLARTCGKKAVFTTIGGDTELDRTMVEEIADPLVHMVRNALDHGLETPAERTAAGKPEAGAISLEASHQGGQVVIELRDDGRGLDPERILAKAKRQGLVPEEARPTRDEIFSYIFLPGFSTAEKVTAVSGRGVGMDVVKRNVERLRGKIEILSELGHGAAFQVKLPLTMAIIDGLIVKVGDDRFILPSTSVQRALRPARENISTVRGCGEVLDLRGRIFPLFRLDRRFGIASRAKDPWDGIVVIVEASDRIFALLVDEMVSKQEVVIKNLGSYLQGLPGVAGGAILGDGSIALILDPGAFLQAA